MLDQGNPIVLSQIDSGQLERRRTAALLERSDIPIQRDQRQKALAQMFLHADVGAQHAVETFDRARGSDHLIQRFIYLSPDLRKILNLTFPVFQTDQRVQVALLSGSREMRACGSIPTLRNRLIDDLPPHRASAPFDLDLLQSLLQRAEECAGSHTQILLK